MMPATRSLLIALALIPWTASGQETPAQPTPAPLVDVGFGVNAPVPPSARAEQAAQAEAVMDATLEQTLVRLETAREARDIVQVNCVTARLAAIKGVLGIVRQARRSLDEAAARGDRTLIEHEARKIGIARARAESFRVQVEGCVGEISQYTGDTRVDLQVDAALRADDPSRAERRPVFAPISLARPPALSGSQ